MKKTQESKSWIKREFDSFIVLMRSMPILVIVIFSLSVIAMNLLANIIVYQTPRIAINAGMFVSWISFLFMDIVTKHFGVKAANIVSIIGIFFNSIAVVVFFVISQIGTYPQLDMILHGQWSIWLASTIAFIASAVLNNYLNLFIGKLFKKNPDGKVAYVTRSYVSTFFGQIADNLLFSSLAFIVFPLIPGASQITLSFWQCLGTSVLCALIELVMEVIFSPIGYKIVQNWKKREVGKEYIEKYCSTEA